ncbi:MAG: glycosyltransferase [Myxococcales bacterium]|nr:glycosyltransferase [Myxococcales bacterium]
MRIAVLSDLETSGGAARCTTRLASSLREGGHDVQRIVGIDPANPVPGAARMLAPSRVERRLARVLAPRLPDLTRRLVQARVAATLDATLARTKPDVVNVHNVHFADWGPEIVEVCARHAPVVWTLHDMWSMTGRCAYAYECRRFVSGCDASCPTADEYPALAPDRIAAAWLLRERLWRRLSSLTIVAPSRWLAGEARGGLWRHHRIETIPYGVPLDLYRPRDQERARIRATLGVGERDVLALVVAASVAERRKGFRYVVDALSAGPIPGLHLGVIGHGGDVVELEGVPLHRLGYVSDEARMAELYAAADLLIHPAPVDNLPNVVLEAMACGTPTLAFEIGGLPDMVRPGLTGWFASELSGRGLRAGLEHAVEELARGQALRQSCREVAVAEYRPELQAERYESVFRSLGAASHP